jgi:hypothetical protein
LIPEPRPIQRTAWCGVGVGESVRKSLDLEKKIRKTKLGLLTAAMVFSATKSNAQETVQDSIPNNPTSYTKSYNPIDSLTSQPSIKFPTDKLPQDSLVADSTRQIIDYLNGINLDTLLNVDAFVKEHSSSAPRINFDSIFNLPWQQREEFILNARQRLEPTIQINEVSWKEYKQTMADLGAFPYGLFHENFNMIELSYFDLSTIPKSEKHMKVLLEAMNCELPFNYLHEKKHSFDRLHRNLGGLNIEQDVQYEYHYEFIVKVLRMMIGAHVYNVTGSIQKAFPELSVQAALRYIKENPHDTNLTLEKLLNKEDISDFFTPDNIEKYWEDFKPYILYLISDKPHDLSTTELAVLFESAQQSMQREAEYYADTQISAPDRIQMNITNAYYACQKWTKNRTETLPDFDKTISEMYMGMLDLINQETFQQFLTATKDYMDHTKVITKTVAQTHSFKKYIDFCTVVRKAANVSPIQELDVVAKNEIHSQILTTTIQAER